jgi:hypothetical protein
MLTCVFSFRIAGAVCSASAFKRAQDATAASAAAARERNWLISTEFALSRLSCKGYEKKTKLMNMTSKTRANTIV